MCYQNSVADRAMESESGGGPYAPGTDHTTVKQRISQLPNDMLKQAVVDTQRLINSSHAELACLVAELDARELPEIDDSFDRRRLPELDGYAVDPETVRRWACDAGIVRIVTDGDSIPIDVGRRTRTIPPALRRALEHRDKGCVWPGCGAPIGWCDAHHIVHWAHGGPTSLDNCELLCRRHHTATHDGWRRPAEP